MTPRQLTLAYAASQILSACLDIGALIASAVAAYGGAASTNRVCKPGSGNQEICRFPVWSLSVAIVGHVSMLAYSAVAVLGPVTSTQTTAGVLIGGGCLAAELAPSIIISSSFETSTDEGWRAAVALMYTASIISFVQLLLIVVSRNQFKKAKRKKLTAAEQTKSPISTVDSRVAEADGTDDQGGFGISKLRSSFHGLMSSLGRRKRNKPVQHDSDHYPRPQNQEEASPYAISNVFCTRDQHMMQPIPMQSTNQQPYSFDDNNYQQPYYGTAYTTKEAASNEGFASDEGGIERTRTHGAWPYSTTEI